MKTFILACCVVLILLSNSQGKRQESPKLYPIIKNHKVGYVDQTGTIVIRPQFDYAPFDFPHESAPALRFSNGLASVKLDGWTGYIDTTGRFSIKAQFENGSRFSEGLAYVQAGDLRGYIDRTGTLVIKTNLAYPTGPFADGLAAVRLGTDSDPHCGYMDRTGGMAIDARFSTCGDFSEGLASVSTLGSGTSYINHAGDVVFSLEGFADGEQFSEGFAKVWTSNAKIGFVDRSGKVVLEPQYDYAKNFSEGLAAIELKSKWGYIEKSGHIAVNPQYVYADDFSDGLASVCLNDPNSKSPQRMCGYIDKSKTLVIPMQFVVAYKFHEGLALVAIGDINNRQWGYIDQRGKYVWSPTR